MGHNSYRVPGKSNWSKSSEMLEELSAAKKFTMKMTHKYHLQGHLLRKGKFQRKGLIKVSVHVCPVYSLILWMSLFIPFVDTCIVGTVVDLTWTEKDSYDDLVSTLASWPEPLGNSDVKHGKWYNPWSTLFPSIKE